MPFQPNPPTNAISKQRGAIAIMAAIFLIPLISFAALAFNIGHISIARNELQNAADAAALAGANCFYPSATTGCTASSGNPLPDLTSASNKATNAVGTASITGLNQVDNTALTTATVTKGYWDISGATAGVHATKGANDLPAVQVTINKTSSNSNGAISNFFGGIMGFPSTTNASATGVAVISSPNTTTANLFPVVISQCMYDSYWNSTTNQPTGIGSSGFDILSSYGGSSSNNGNSNNNGNGEHENEGNNGNNGNSSSCNAGQWSSLQQPNSNPATSPANADTSVQALLQYANGSVAIPSQYVTTYTAGSSTAHISTGAMTNLYSSVNSCSSAGNGTCAYVMVAVVPSINPNTDPVISSFACLHILNATGGNTKAINVQMVAPGNPNCKFPTSGVGTSAYGLTQTSLVNYSGNTY